MSLSRRRIALLAAIVVAMATASLGGVNGWNRWKSRCAAQVAETPAKVLRSIQADPADQVDLGPVDKSHLTNPNAARGVLASARTPGGGFRPATHVLVAGADGRSQDSVQPIGSVNGDPILAAGPPAWLGSALRGSVVVLDRNTGQAKWGRQYFGDEVHGQQRPGRMMVLQLTSRPMAASFADADGRLEWCTWVGKDPITTYRATFTSDVSEDGQLYVVHEPAEEVGERSVLLSRIDSTSGKVAWEQPVGGVDRVSSLDTFGDQVLLSRWDPKMYVDDRWRILNESKDPAAGALVARSATTGESTWTYAGPDSSGWIVNVVGTQGDTAVVVARRLKADPKGGGPSGDALNQSWLIGLDRSGKERWRQDLGSALVYDLAADSKLAGDVVITKESKTSDPQRLVAHDLATGKVRWTREASRSVPEIKLDVSTVVGDRLVAAGTRPRGGLRSIDLVTGKEQVVLTDGDVRNLVGDDTSVTFVADGLVFTLDHA
ncbi:putative pyrroloquinoline-quinone binding quinoprotein [Kribbella sp. VKM Ac-2571]|uniref:outer membrane protein assembly factor BamB family protein n=1 Tax=Kribbella sp. VKM Ac-2571 TaxID=2512222 RepID=UPI00105FE41B|nr:PQQ-binding-like beta-propeller repeat protein [Kribbella sp. VKM Ac-2571]TDO62470.1 putative pyrroloquinoline-quinone binding quinoprotein [Kribbella sp. VKM Ac-2571]